MASTKELRRRIKSIKNTSQITKAMQMVAATKMRRAQSQALSGRPYSLSLNQSLQRLLQSTTPENNPLLEKGEGSQIGIILLTTDKSLCGALNTNLFRAILNLPKEITSNSLFFTVGAKGRNFVVRDNKKVSADFENPEKVTFKEARQLSKAVLDSFLKREIKEAYIAFPKFVSTLKQEPKVSKLLPIDLSMEEEVTKESAHSRALTNREFLFEPTALDLLEYVLLHYLEMKIYSALLETKASEHSARMIAMQNATDNAKELVEDLQLNYNQTRQSAITQEILEITSAGAALE